MANHLLLSLILAGAVAIAACGGGDSQAAPATEDGLRDTVASAFATIFNQEPREGYGYMSEACQDTLSYADYASQVRVGLALYEGFFDVKPEEIEIDEVQVREFTPQRAEVSVLLRTSDGLDLGTDEEEWDEWVYEDGEWKSTDCDTAEG